ncbi:MAG: ABC transporter ATP-binding protein [Actinobacteria bacterium]|nr:ABC transporter ATP-binding protein [Actinomycetota bacterium]
MTSTQETGARPAEQGAALVVLEGVTKRFPGVVANDLVDLTLRAGEIHALVGENGAGKSTLMRVLYGLYPPDGGRILVRDKETRIPTPRAAIGLGIGMVHQHFALVDRFTVTENIILGAEGGALVDFGKAERSIDELGKSYGFNVDPKTKVGALSVGEQQRVEILKALFRGVDVLILDEPTAVLTPSETQDLFQNLRKLKKDGKTVVFISHKLDEVLDIADRITVLRRGKVVGETRPADTTKAKLAEMMVGREVLFQLEKGDDVEAGKGVLKVEGLSLEGHLHDIDLEVHAGEILGVAGVEGNGQRELAETIIGLTTPTSGRVTLGDDDITGRSVAQVRAHGVAFVPEDRHGRGLVLNMSLWENSVLGQHGRKEYSGGWGVLAIRTIKNLCTGMVKEFDVRCRGITTEVSTLSGGNQQKLILARELENDPLLLIAQQPTRGLDVGAIEFVWKQILEQKHAGRAVLLISAELDEIYELSDRIVTLYEGRITGEYSPDDPPEKIGIGMTGARVNAERKPPVGAREPESPS